MKIKTCRREAKESCYWLGLLDTEAELAAERNRLLGEGKELMKIFGAISGSARSHEFSDSGF